MNKKSRLGRGLSSIFNIKHEKTNNPNHSKIDYVDVSLIKKNPFQPRTHISDRELNELADSIKTYGVIQAITIRKNAEISKFI